ncbi:MAG: 1-deoxy-D-xylulose-5-phosphate reductoisomerase [Candidatus Omnitrophica bacterium]|nr:1-deoxy-D-xylulose-5-phosphate reductoisomerase [Candidatus Omnitrophota bacterium]
MKKTVTILGSTGSVGLNTLRVIEEQAASFCVAGLAAASQGEVLRAQIEAFSPEFVFIKDETLARRLQSEFGGRLKVFCEEEGLRHFASAAEADILVAASSGTSALLPVLDALARGRRVALANKEILVMAGALVMESVRKNPGALLIPVDSEHNAIFQCLQGQPVERLAKVILTSSGGPLRAVPAERFRGISKETVINHPKWKMGKKISVDSATLMNKGLEIIEASWLFQVPIDAIEVLIHPEAVIHSMVEFVDGTVLAQLGVADMRLPIQYALSFPDRLPSPSSMKLDFSGTGPLTFEPPDEKKFPCLGLAYEAAKQSGSAPCVLNAADEVAVHAFLENRIDFTEIPGVIEKVLSSHRVVENPGLEDIQSIHLWALEEAERCCQAC